MFGSDMFTKPTQETFQGAYNTMENRAKQMFGTSTAANIRNNVSGYMKDSIMEGLNAYGIDYALNWNNKADEVMKALTDDMRQMTQQAIKAREMGDTAMYKQALQKKLFDQSMAQYADAMSKARIGEILTGIIGGISSLAGDYFGKQKSNQIYKDFMDYVNKRIGEIMGYQSNINISPKTTFGVKPGI